MARDHGTCSSPFRPADQMPANEYSCDFPLAMTGPAGSSYSEEKGDVHPRLVYDGTADPFLRASALGALADTAGLIRDVRAATLFRTAAGPVTIRAAEATLKRESTSADAITEAQLKQGAQTAVRSE